MAIHAYNKSQKAEYVKIMTIVQTILHVGGMVTAAVRDGEFNGKDNLEKVLKLLEKELMPEIAKEEEERTEKIKKLLMDEATKEPFEVQAMGYSRKGTKAGLY